MGLWQDENQVRDLVNSMLDVIETPSNYLAPDKLPFIQRYVCGGVFLAHANWILLRCRSAKFDQEKNDDWIAGDVINTCIASFIRDARLSFDRIKT